MFLFSIPICILFGITAVVGATATSTTTVIAAVAALVVESVAIAGLTVAEF